MSEVLYEVQDAIATPNRPERLNTISRTMLRQLADLLVKANAVVPDAQLHARARAVAQEIAANAPLAVRAAKRQMRRGLSETFNDHVHHVYLQFVQLTRTADVKEGMTSFLEKRPARFEGR